MSDESDQLDRLCDEMEYAVAAWQSAIDRMVWWRFWSWRADQRRVDIAEAVVQGLLARQDRLIGTDR